MPIHDLGYRAWQGKLNSGAPRWSIIARAGIRQAWKSRWLRRVMFFAWLPTMYFAAMFFFFEKAVQDPVASASVLPMVLQLPGARDLPAFEKIRLNRRYPTVEQLEDLKNIDFGAVRHSVWSWLLMTFFRYSQMIMLAMVVGMLAPPLIAQDIRSRAFLLYFSRPLGRWEYIFGKMWVIGFYLVIMATLPALALYLFGVLLSPSVSVVLVTWDLPLRILGASVVLILPTVSLALALSSLSIESRYATFAWFSIWVMGWVAFGTITTSSIQITEQTTPDMIQHQFENSRWGMLSLYHLLGHAQAWVMGTKPNLSDAFPYMIVLGSITVLSLAVVFNRVSKPMRV